MIKGSHKFLPHSLSAAPGIRSSAPSIGRTRSGIGTPGTRISRGSLRQFNQDTVSVNNLRRHPIRTAANIRTNSIRLRTHLKLGRDGDTMTGRGNIDPDAGDIAKEEHVLAISLPIHLTRLITDEVRGQRVIGITWISGDHEIDLESGLIG